MPLYEYQCTKCEARTERIEKVSGPHLKRCPKCGGSVERMPSAPAIQFKGSGWYVTDYAGKSGGGDSGKSEKTEGTEKADAKESKESAPAKAPKKETQARKEK